MPVVFGTRASTVEEIVTVFLDGIRHRDREDTPC